MEMMADRSGTPTAQKYPMMSITSGSTPSISGVTGPVALVELVTGSQLYKKFFFCH